MSSSTDLSAFGIPPRKYFKSRDISNILAEVSKPLKSKDVIRIAKENNINLVQLKNLDEILELPIGTWYLYIIGAEHHIGHFVLLRLDEHTYRRKTFRIIKIFSSHNLSSDAQKELNEFHKIYKIPIVPALNYTVQPVTSFDSEVGDSTCGRWVLYYLLYHKLPNDVIELDNMDLHKPEESTIKTDEKTPALPKFNNEVSILRNFNRFARIPKHKPFRSRDEILSEALSDIRKSTMKKLKSKPKAEKAAVSKTLKK